MMNAGLAKTALYDWHVEQGGKMVDFAGWSMPVVYDSTMNEHVATRQRASLFDVSHMGRFRFDGPGAVTLLDGILSRRVTNIKPNQIRYGLVTNDSGGILDDILVYHLVGPGQEPYFAMVVNAGNRQKIAAWIREQQSVASGAAAEVEFTDETLGTAMIAVQGPRAIEIVQRMTAGSLNELPYYNGISCELEGVPAVISRTGYTGEDGCEVTVAAEQAVAIWSKLLEHGAAEGIVAAGLGARDTLRLEAAMPLYGHELSEEIDPFQAGLGFAVHLKDRSFPGSLALTKLKNEARKMVRVGLRMDGKRAARENYEVFAKDHKIGYVTSGTFSPTLQLPIAMAYVPQDSADVGEMLEIDIRGRRHAAQVVDLPFYQRPS